MNHTRGTLRFCTLAAAAVAGLLAGASAFGQASVTLKPSANVAAGSAVTLGQVAEISGPDGAALKDAVVATAPVAGGTAQVDVTRVKAALRDRPGVVWGKLTLSGGVCTVRAEEGGPTEAPKVEKTKPAPAPAPVVEDPRTTLPEPIVHGSVDTVRVLIAQRASDQFAVSMDEMRLRLSVNGGGDGAWLDAPIKPGIRCEIVQIGPPTGSRMPLRIDQYQRDRLIFSKPVMVDLLVHRTIVSPTVRIERDQVITADQVTVSDEWLSPTAAFVTDLDQVVGATPRKRLDPGRPIVPSDLQSPVVVQRGEAVWVDVLSGSAVIRAKARAMGSGRDGELVQFQLDGSRKTFTARMNGRGRAVMEVDPTAAENATFEATPRSTKPTDVRPVDRKPTMNLQQIRRKTP
ncbi:MAG: flagellar basal body P-ring formation chaperone FlgA [Phycisphaerales bacterium]